MCLCIQLSSFVNYYIIYLKQDRISVSANIDPKISIIGISVYFHIGDISISLVIIHL